jgi:hypothetical protein
LHGCEVKEQESVTVDDGEWPGGWLVKSSQDHSNSSNAQSNLSFYVEDENTAHASNPRRVTMDSLQEDQEPSSNGCSDKDDLEQDPGILQELTQREQTDWDAVCGKEEQDEDEFQIEEEPGFRDALAEMEMPEDIDRSEPPQKKLKQATLTQQEASFFAPKSDTPRRQESSHQQCMTLNGGTRAKGQPWISPERPLTLLTALTPEPLPELLCEQGMVEENNKAGHTCAYQLSSNKSAHAPKPTGERPRATLDLFAGCGGLLCGFQQEGCEETCMVELDPIACATLATNFPDAKIYQERAEHFLETCESETMKSCPKLGDVGHINATQGQFSTSKFL